ncbi:rhodanese-like domain-containing protein [Kaistia dalseonensis]|uniref:Rhodanese-related sulfurtransferase n=1 Tax=Kaistia dalseonensis TaxID=410840 RepID=A0ABU0H4Z6_9HYPH|nr:rhodanese-like domain-containing protein [Kaistia dalseonensis]MCX5494774.1 rhodanese-like domain-containing protein [Kaistia dalseonensis]MDQ0437355.1 rhodanese-related sulfurtransferase [Kaistia dalseonensis]
MSQANTLIELEPAELADRLESGEVLLVDVREEAEFDAVHIDGAVLMPLSVFDPAALPDADGRTIVFQCAAGGRSARAVAACLAAGLPHSHHLRGGIRAWMSAGLPTVD